jgi:hypothetical protein
MDLEGATLDAEFPQNGFRPDAVKIDAEGAASNILARAENMNCQKIILAAYHFPMEEVQVSMKLRNLGFKMEIKQVQASIYGSTLQPFVPLLLGWKDS